MLRSPQEVYEPPSSEPCPKPERGIEGRRTMRHFRTELASQPPTGLVEPRMLIPEPTEIRNWILAWGKECVVVAPTALRDSICEELEEAAAGYLQRAAQRSNGG